MIQTICTGKETDRVRELIKREMDADAFVSLAAFEELEKAYEAKCEEVNKLIIRLREYEQGDGDELVSGAGGRKEGEG